MVGILDEVRLVLTNDVRPEPFYINRHGLSELLDEAFALAPTRAEYDDLVSFIRGVESSSPRGADAPAIGFRDAQKAALLAHVNALFPDAVEG